MKDKEKICFIWGFFFGETVMAFALLTAFFK